jgi:zinc/manganese transport system substrate-binding protein
MKSNLIRALMILLPASAAFPLNAGAASALRVFTTLPDLAFMAREVGGSRVQADSLLSGVENPHYVDARPDLIRQVSQADIVCAVGMELEAGWLPRVLQKSGNARVQTGGNGFCELGLATTVLQKPTGPVDRSMGDVHPFGNPHFWLSPLALAESSRKLAAILALNDPEGESAYTANQQAFEKRMTALVTELKPRLQEALKKSAVTTPVIEYHQEYTYFFNAYGIRSFGSIEERPGVPPSALRLGQIALQAKGAKVKLAVSAPYAPLSLIHKFSELSGIPHVTIPTSSRKAAQYDYEKVHRETVEAIIRGLDGSLSHR